MWWMTSSQAAPGAIFEAIDSFKPSPSKIYGWAAVRVLMGGVLILGAAETAFPVLIRFIGAALVLKAALVPLLGLNQVRSILEWFQDRPPLLVRFLCLLVAAFGAFLVWGLLNGHPFVALLPPLIVALQFATVDRNPTGLVLVTVFTALVGASG